jgi:uncharacterized membrane protein YoaK (UPF0700 family)
MDYAMGISVSPFSMGNAPRMRRALPARSGPRGLWAGLYRAGLYRAGLDASTRNALVLSAVAGFVDASAFTALHGLLPAHVTGLLIAASSEVVQSGGALFERSALVIAFVASVLGTVVVFRLLEGRGFPGLPTLLALLTLTISGLAAIAVWLAPLARSADGGAVLILSSAAVCAMGVQNTLMRLGLRSSCPTTVMTGNLTQVIVQGADALASGRSKHKARSGPEVASQPAALSLLGFVLGALGGIVLTHSFGLVSCWLPAAVSAGLTAAAWREAANCSALTERAAVQKSFALP